MDKFIIINVIFAFISYKHTKYLKSKESGMPLPIFKNLRYYLKMFAGFYVFILPVGLIYSAFIKEPAVIFLRGEPNFFLMITETLIVTALLVAYTIFWCVVVLKKQSP